MNIKLYFFIKSQVEVEELKNVQKKNQLKKKDLEKQIKTLNAENELSTKKLIRCFFANLILIFFLFIEFQLKHEQLKKSLEAELLNKQNLKTQMEKLQTENESCSKKVIIFFVVLD